MESSNNGNSLEMETMENRNTGKHEHWKTGTLKTETSETGTSEKGTSENRNSGTSENRKDDDKQDRLERKKILLMTGTIQSYFFMSAVLKELTLVSLAFQSCLIW